MQHAASSSAWCGGARCCAARGQYFAGIHPCTPSGFRCPLTWLPIRTDLACDLCIGGSGSLFKSVLLGQLAALDWWVGALIRLVKAWARQQGINNAGEGTLSSHALSLMVGGRPQLQSTHRGT